MTVHEQHCQGQRYIARADAMTWDEGGVLRLTLDGSAPVRREHWRCTCGHTWITTRGRAPERAA